MVTRGCGETENLLHIVSKLMLNNRNMIKCGLVNKARFPVLSQCWLKKSSVLFHTWQFVFYLTYLSFFVFLFSLPLSLHPPFLLFFLLTTRPTEIHLSLSLVLRLSSVCHEAWLFSLSRNFLYQKFWFKEKVENDCS